MNFDFKKEITIISDKINEIHLIFESEANNSIIIKAINSNHDFFSAS